MSARARPSTCAACGFEGSRGWDACPRCGVWGSALPNAKQGAQAPAGRVRLADLPDVPVPRLRCAEPWSTVLGGGLAEGSTVLVYGKRGERKTTGLVQLAGSLGPRVMLCPCEMGQNAGSLHEVARRSGTDARDLWVSSAYKLGELCAELARPPAPRAFLLDSLSALAPDAEVAALLALRRALPRACALVCIVHVTKAGGMGGEEKLAHACDTIVRVTATHLTTEGEKNRYGALCTAPRPALTF